MRRVEDIFPTCRRILARAAAAGAEGRLDRARALVERLASCSGRAAATCPRVGVCRDVVPELPPGDGFGDEGLRINGRPVRFGLMHSLHLRDPAGDEAHLQVLSLDVARAYETTQMRDVIQLYEQRQRPGFSDFDVSRLRRVGLTDWLGVTSFEDVSEKFYIAYPPGFGRILGANYAGTTAQALPPAAIAAILQMSRQVRDGGRAAYCRVERTWVDADRIKRFAYRRMELPLFRGTRVVGSMIYIVPERWTIDPHVVAA